MDQEETEGLIAYCAGGEIRQSNEDAESEPYSKGVC